MEYSSNQKVPQQKAKSPVKGPFHQETGTDSVLVATKSSGPATKIDVALLNLVPCFSHPNVDQGVYRNRSPLRAIA